MDNSPAKMVPRGMETGGIHGGPSLEEMHEFTSVGVPHNLTCGSTTKSKGKRKIGKRTPLDEIEEATCEPVQGSI
jgi:hypothetical protein